jgi:hypothetical protein
MKSITSTDFCFDSPYAASRTFKFRIALPFFDCTAWVFTKQFCSLKATNDFFGLCCFLFSSSCCAWGSNSDQLQAYFLHHVLELTIHHSVVIDGRLDEVKDGRRRFQGLMKR